MNQPKVKYSLSNWDLVTVNPNYKTWNSKDLFCFWGVNIQSVIAFSLIASLYIVYDLNTLVVFFGTILGSFLVYFFSNLIGKPSQKFGLPFAVLLRSSLGFKGARYLGLIRALVGIFMFGVQTYFLSKAFGYLIRILFFSVDSSLLSKDIFLFFLLGINIIDWISFIIVIIFQILIFSVGINFNKRLINYSAITVYAGMIVFFFAVLLSDVKLTSQAFAELLYYKNILDGENIFVLLSVAGAIFAYFSIIIVTFGDFSRYVNNEAELKKGNLSLIANLIIFSFFSVFIVIGSDVFLNLRFFDLNSILTNPNDIIGKFDDTLITVLAIVFIIISSTSTNLVANLIPSQYSLINFLPKSLNLKSASYTILILSFFVGIFWPTVLSQIGILSFVDTLVSFFGPLFGIMLVDFYFISSQSISNKDIYLNEPRSIYYYSNGWHIKGIYSLLIGFIFSTSTIWNLNLMFLQSFGWIIGAFISSLTYYLLAKR
jgi:NCS1 family nucleobase:cation symporter-1